MVTYYVKIGEVYKVSATQKCDVHDGNNNVLSTCLAGSIAVFNAPTAKISLSDDDAVLTCMSDVSGDLGGVAEHIHNQSIHSTSAEKVRWNTAVTDVNSVKNQIDGFAPLDSPDFTGTPTAPTPTIGANDMQIATTAFVKNVVSSKQDKKIGVANKVLVSDSDGSITASGTIGTTELSYLNGVTSNIQTQLNNINNKAGGGLRFLNYSSKMYLNGSADQFNTWDAGSIHTINITEDCMVFMHFNTTTNDTTVEKVKLTIDSAVFDTIHINGGNEMFMMPFTENTVLKFETQHKVNVKLIKIPFKS